MQGVQSLSLLNAFPRGAPFSRLQSKELDKSWLCCPLPFMCGKSLDLNAAHCKVSKYSLAVSIVVAIAQSQTSVQSRLACSSSASSQATVDSTDPIIFRLPQSLILPWPCWLSGRMQEPIKASGWAIGASAHDSILAALSLMPAAGGCSSMSAPGWDEGVQGALYQIDCRLPSSLESSCSMSPSC